MIIGAKTEPNLTERAKTVAQVNPLIYGIALQQYWLTWCYFALLIKCKWEWPVLYPMNSWIYSRMVLPNPIVKISETSSGRIRPLWRGRSLMVYFSKHKKINQLKTRVLYVLLQNPAKNLALRPLTVHIYFNVQSFLGCPALQKSGGKAELGHFGFPSRRRPCLRRGRRNRLGLCTEKGPSGNNWQSN